MCKCGTYANYEFSAAVHLCKYTANLFKIG